MMILLIKASVSVVLTVFIVASVRFQHPLIHQIRVSPSLWILFLAIVFRLIPFVFIYSVLRIAPENDVVAYFYPQAQSSLAGNLVYRDFSSNYSPGFPYILALPVALWLDPRAIFMLMFIVEGIAVLGTDILFRPQMTVSQRRMASLLYYLMPASFGFLVFMGQEDVWLWLFGLLVIGLVTRNEEFQAGLAAGLGLLVTKALILIPMLPLLLPTKRTYSMSIGFLFVTAIGFGSLYAVVGSTILTPFGEAENVLPPNVWFLVNPFLGGVVPLGDSRLSILSLMIVVVVPSLVVLMRGSSIRESRTSLSCIWILTFCLMLILSPKSFSTYLLAFLLPLIYIASLKNDSQTIYVTVALSLLASIQPSLWFRLGSPVYDSFSFVTNPGVLIEFTIEALMLGLYAILAYRAWAWIDNGSKSSSSLPVSDSVS